jgi:hypothetical protein
MAAKSTKARAGLAVPKWTFPIASPPADPPIQWPADPRLITGQTEPVAVAESVKAWLALGGRMGLIPDVAHAQGGVEAQIKDARGYGYPWGVVVELADEADTDAPASIFWDIYLPELQFTERAWAVGPRTLQMMANFFIELADEFDEGLPVTWTASDRYALIRLVVFSDDSEQQAAARTWMAETFVTRVVPAMSAFIACESEAFYYEIVSRLSRAA